MTNKKLVWVSSRWDTDNGGEMAYIRAGNMHIMDCEFSKDGVDVEGGVDVVVEKLNAAAEAWAEERGKEAVASTKRALMESSLWSDGDKMRFEAFSDEFMRELTRWSK